MTDRNPERPTRVEPDDIEREVIDAEPIMTERHVDDRGGFHDTAPNPHDDAGTAETAARATGAMAGMFFPAVILAIIAAAVILYFVLR